MPRVKGRFIEAPHDANQTSVVGWYERLGCSVKDCSMVGGGFPDLAIGCAGISDLAEVKMPGEDLRPSQHTFNDSWRGSKPWRVETMDDVVAHVTDMRARARGAK